MAFTYQSVVDLARTPLNDDDKARYPDATLLLYANHGILQILKRRPDLFVGQFGSLPAGDATLDDMFPLPAGYVQTLADYVTARAEMADDEHVNSGRAAAFVQLFAAEAQP
jgi:hypothetical protein